MALTIRWTKRAEKKIDKIIEYLLIEWNGMSKLQKRLLKKYMNSLMHLLTFLK